MLHNKLFKLLLLGAVLTSCLAVVSCAKAEEDVAVPAVAGEPFTFSVVEEDPIKVDPVTKSVLTDGTIETKRTGITIGVYYTGGALVASQYYTSFGDMTFPLENGVSYTAYALVNMGDMRSSLPGTTAGLSSLTYTIPAYTGTAESVNSRGIPMAGSLTFTVSSGSAEIPVKRLLAKVTAVLSCDWAEAKIKSAKVYNMNKTLKPFGVSAASGASDMLAFQELQSAVGEGTTSLVATFYVPENMQGTVAGITGSSDKAGDRNATVGANAAKLTYLETSVESVGKYDGAIVYRSYLGNNATTNFDLERNCRYAWTIHYKSDKVDEWDDDWKHDYDDLEIIDYSLSVSPASATITAGSTLPLTTTLTKLTIRPAPDSDPSVISNNLCTWESSNPSVATVSPSGVVTGVSTGTTRITASYTPAHFSTPRSGWSNITVQTVSNYIAITAINQSTGDPLSGDPLTADWQHDIKLTAKYYTVTDGTPDEGVDVTNVSDTWSKQDGDASVSVSSTGVVSASTYGSAVIRAEYAGVYKDVNVQFNRTDRYLLLSHSPATPVAGQNVQMAAAVRTVTNGVVQSDANINASLVSWNISSKSDPTAVVSIDAAGVLTASKAVTANITATYDGLNSTYITSEHYPDADPYPVTFAPATGHILVLYNGSVRIPTPPTNVEREVGESAVLTAKLVTLTDGVEDGEPVDVTANWTKLAGGSSNVNFTPSSAPTTTVTATSYGTATIDAAYYIDGGWLHASCPVVFHETSHRLVLTASGATTKNVGETVYLVATHYVDRDGVNQSAEVVSVASGTTWTCASGSTNLSIAKGSTYGEVTATAGGTATFSAGYEYAPSKYVYSDSSIPVTFNDVISYELEITPMGPITGKTYNTTANLTATYYTKVNGFRQYPGTIVTSLADWHVSNDTKYGVTGGVVSADASIGDHSVAGTVSVYAEYLDKNSNTVYVTFDDDIDHEVRVTASAASIQAAGDPVRLYANYVTTTNGFDTASTDVSGNASTIWTSSNANVSITKTAPPTNRADASANSSATGTFRATATYAGKSGSSEEIPVTDASVDYELEIVKVDGSGTIASPVRLKAKYWTLVAGSRTTHIDVTASAGWGIPTNPYDPSRHSISIVYSGDPDIGYYAVVSADASLGDHSVAGTLGIHASYNGKGADKDVDFTDIVTYELEVMATTSTTGRKWNAPASLVATYYTVTNSYRTSGTNVSNSATWYHSGGSVYTVTANVSDATVAGNTSANASHAIEGTTTVYATYSALTSNNVSVSFVDEKSIDIRTDAGVSVAAPKLAVGVNRSFKAYYTVNGISGYVAANWSTGSSSIATVTTGAVTVTATGVSAGNTTLTVSYGTGTVAASKIVGLTVVSWSDDWDDDGDLDL